MAELAAGVAPSRHLGDHSDRPQDWWMGAEVFIRLH